MDVVQSNRTNLADGNDNIADQTSKRSAVLPAESTVSTSQIELQAENFKLPIIGSVD